MEGRGVPGGAVAALHWAGLGTRWVPSSWRTEASGSQVDPCHLSPEEVLGKVLRGGPLVFAERDDDKDVGIGAFILDPRTHLAGHWGGRVRDEVVSAWRRPCCCTDRRGEGHLGGRAQGSAPALCGQRPVPPRVRPREGSSLGVHRVGQRILNPKQEFDRRAQPRGLFTRRPQSWSTNFEPKARVRPSRPAARALHSASTELVNEF